MTYVIDGLCTTSTVDRSAATEAWTHWVNEAHGEFDFRLIEKEYRGTVVRQNTPSYQLISWTSEREHVVRDRRRISRDPRGHYELIVPVRGTLHVGVGDADHTLTPGELALLPVDQPFHLAHDDGVFGLMFLIPFERIDSRLGVKTSRSQRLVSDAGMPRIVRDLLAGLARERDHLTQTEFDALCDRAVDLVCLSVDGETQPTERSGTVAVAAAVRGFVRANLTEESLTVASVAQAVGWSPRYVQACLTREGTTFTEVLRDERLALARVRLASPGFAHQSIASVAMSVGFQSPSAFSAAFRETYGVSPRAYRQS